MSSAALCRAPLRPTPLAHAAAANKKAALAAAPRSSSPATPASAASLRCRAALPSADVGSDWPANWALASFEDVGEYFNTKLLKVRS